MKILHLKLFPVSGKPSLKELLHYYFTVCRKDPYIIDHEVHNGLGHEVPDALVDDGHVGVHQVTDGLHLPLQLRIHGEVLCGTRALTLHLMIRGKIDVLNK